MKYLFCLNSNKARKVPIRLRPVCSSSAFAGHDASLERVLDESVKILDEMAKWEDKKYIFRFVLKKRKIIIKRLTQRLQQEAVKLNEKLIEMELISKLDQDKVEKDAKKSVKKYQSRAEDLKKELEDTQAKWKAEQSKVEELLKEKQALQTEITQLKVVDQFFFSQL